jgi:hypothetical protein
MLNEYTETCVFAEGTQRTPWDIRAWTPAELVALVRVFQQSGLMAPEFTVTAYMRLEDVGDFKAAVLHEYPKSNPQIIFHTYEDQKSCFHASRMSAELVDIEMIFFVGGSGGVGRFFFDPNGEDKFTSTGKKGFRSVYFCFMSSFPDHLLFV